ncbi:MAG: TonB-dependent receptor, partial [Pseudomonadota bacterium]
FDGFGVDSREYSKNEELVVYAGLNFALLDGRLKNRIGYGYTDTNRENLNPDDPFTPKTFDAQGENRRWEYQGSFAITETWSTVFGFESEDAEMTSWSPYAPVANGKASVDSVYGQLQGEITPGLTVTGGLRHDSHDVYGDHTLGSLSAAWVVNGGDTILRASFAQGFRAPGLYELFSEYGNAALDPEEFDSWDAGVEQRLFDDKVTVSATYFRREADNEIRFFSCSFGSPDPMCNPGGVFRFGYYENVQKTQTQGVELIGQTDFGPLILSGNYTWTDAQNASGANDGKQLTRRPEHMANLTLGWRWTDAFSTTAAVRYVGESFNNASNTDVVDAWTTVDLRASWQATEALEFYGRVENLFDEDYEIIRNYGTAGRGAFVGLRARF